MRRPASDGRHSRWSRSPVDGRRTSSPCGPVSNEGDRPVQPTIGGSSVDSRRSASGAPGNQPVRRRETAVCRGRSGRNSVRSEHCRAGARCPAGCRWDLPVQRGIRRRRDRSSFGTVLTPGGVRVTVSRIRSVAGDSDVAILGAILGFMIGGQVLVTDPVLRYGSALLAFSLWMAWFVLTAVRALGIGR